jgi:hypothetical protein
MDQADAENPHRVAFLPRKRLVLEMVWARHLKANGAPPTAMLELFYAPKTPPLRRLAEKVLNKTLKVHYFDPNGQAKNISDLDPDTEETGEQRWGGPTEFSGRANAAVARAVANAKGGK